MENTIKFIKQFKVVLFIPFFVCLTSVGIFSQLLDIDTKLTKARSNYLLQNYVQTITILNELIKYVDENNNIETKNDILAEINFLYGACYIGWNREDIAKVRFKSVLEFNPTYEIDDEIYDENLFKIFNEIKQNKKFEKTIEPEQTKTTELKQTITTDLGKIAKDSYYVKVVRENATLMLFEDKESEVIMKIPLGAMLDVELIEREWIKVSLLPNKDGIIITGYVHISFIEVEPKLYKKK